MKQCAAGEQDQPQVSRWHYREKLMKLKQVLHPAKVNALVDAVEDRLLCKRSRLQAWWEIIHALPLKLKFSLLFWYWTCSGFGERHGRAWWCLLALVVFPLFPLSGLKLAETGFSWAFDKAALSELLAEWVRCMPLTKLELVTSKSAPFLASVRFALSWVFQVAIALQAALFALAVRNRFRR